MFPIYKFIISLLLEFIDPYTACFPYFIAYSYYFFAYYFYFIIPYTLFPENYPENL